MLDSFDAKLLRPGLVFQASLVTPLVLLLRILYPSRGTLLQSLGRFIYDQEKPSHGRPALLSSLDHLIIFLLQNHQLSRPPLSLDSCLSR